jgi:hypothetical protein
MADTVVDISFTDVPLSSFSFFGPGGSATATGSFSVDYTTNTATGTVTFNTGGVDDMTFSGTTALLSNSTDYTLQYYNGSNFFEIKWPVSTETPSTMNQIIYSNVDGNNYMGGGSALTSTAACFCAGTRIATPDGAVAVEELAIGDLVITQDGRTQPVVWIGRRRIASRFAERLRVWPVRVTAGALAENVPSRDLRLSPDHALYLEGVLVHAGALVNGSTILRETEPEEIFTYFHVELADHAVISAEGAPVESFVDNQDRLAFDNWSEHEALFPGGRAIDEMPYPRAKSYRQVPQAVRALIERRAQALGLAGIASAA